MEDKFLESIVNINKNIIKCNVSLKNYNTMKLECTCKYFISPSNFIELKKVLVEINKYKINYYLIGNGSNIIFTDKEKECIIKLNFNKSKYCDIFMASELLMIKANEFYKNGYGGLEYISNIPASIGGAILMNAGAYNHNISDIIEYVYYLDEDFKLKVLSKINCNFKYRESIFKNSKKIILGCKVFLERKDKSTIKNIMEECKYKRIRTQPNEYPNSGSIFKNKDKIYAWKLIEDASLKGLEINGAKISEKHCNFIINFNNAKNDDVISLIGLIKNRVKEKFDIELEEEVIIID